jgi:hypothetical protein
MLTPFLFSTDAMICTATASCIISYLLSFLAMQSESLILGQYLANDYPRIGPLDLHTALMRYVLEQNLNRDALKVRFQELVNKVMVFPRTALILLELLPRARIVIVDADARNLETARSILGGSVEFVNRRYAPGDPCDCDLVVIPLSFDGDRTTIYRRLPSPAVLVHDWIWRHRGTGKVVSAALLKRLNLVTR